MCISVRLTRANLSRTHFIYYMQRAAYGAHKLMHCCHKSIFSPTGRLCAPFSGCLDFGSGFCLTKWVECSTELSIVGQEWMPSRNCLHSKPPWLMQPLSPSLFLRSCCRPSLTGSQDSFSPWLEFLLVFLLPPFLGVSSLTTKKTNPSTAFLRLPPSTTMSTWRTSHRVLVAIQQKYWNYYEWFNSIKKKRQ